jgi:hypothetical protein
LGSGHVLIIGAARPGVITLLGDSLYTREDDTRSVTTTDKEQTMTSEVCKTIISQVREQVFIKRTQRLVLLSDSAVRFNFGRTNIDVAYNAGLDLYDVSVHKLAKDYTSKTVTTGGVYAEDLAKFFPKRLVKDDNVRALFAQIAAARRAA